MTRRIVHFDSTGGASGDMILACMIGLGAKKETIIKGLKSLTIGRFSVDARRAQDSYFSGLRVRVAAPEKNQPHRYLSDIGRLIKRSKLPPAVKTSSMAVFTRLAEAEARVHGISVRRIHFHEVGAMDSIIDIVGSCLGLHLLGADSVSFGPLPTGTGTLKCSHGTMPNPPPATADLLRGCSLEFTDEPFELVTPTAAAFFTALNAKSGQVPTIRTSLAVATAVGHRKLQRRPNLLRATLLEVDSFTDTSALPAGQGDICHVLECNLDDTTAEVIGHVTRRLLDAGALDVFTTAVTMKKQRPGTLLTTLCKPGDRQALITLILEETTTFGVREYTVRRTTLGREHKTVPTRYGRIRIKLGILAGRVITQSPEFEDCATAARRHRVPVRRVMDASIQTYLKTTQT